MDVVELMKRRLADAEDDARRLRAAIAELEGDAAASPATPSAPARSTRTRRGGSPALSADELLRLVPTAGISRGLLVEQTKASQARVTTLLKALESEGLVRREGERKLTRWFPITDDDRVAARAAQLRRQSRSATA